MNSTSGYYKNFREPKNSDFFIFSNMTFRFMDMNLIPLVFLVQGENSDNLQFRSGIIQNKTGLPDLNLRT